MINSLKLLLLTLKTRLFQVFYVSIAIMMNQISYYPKSVKSFERNYRKGLNIRNAMMFSNATSAIEAALFSVGINSSSIVGTTAFVIPSSYSSVKSLSSKLKFFDIDINNLNFDLKYLKNDPDNLSAIVVTHFYGNPCNMEYIMDWARRNNIFVIEDCSHAHGAEFKGKPVGTWGDIGIFSLQGAKAIAAGEHLKYIRPNN